jgi:hypothetical protein
MSSKTNFKHTVSTTIPSTAGNLGDEWYNPSTNKWYKLFANSGTTVRWTEVSTSNISVIAPINGNVTIDGNVIAKSYLGTGNLIIGSSGNIILLPGAGSSVIGAGSSAVAGGSGLFNTSITNSTNYAATNTLATAITFTAKSILHSVYVTNIDSSANANVGVTATILGTTSNAPFLWNMPMPYRSSFEALKKPKIVNAGDAIQVQGLINNTGANSNIHATIVYEELTSGTYTGINSNIITASANVDIFTASGASILESVMISSINNLGNVPVTVTVTDASNVIQGYMAYQLLMPIGATVELCEKPRRITSGHKIQAFTNSANALAIFVAAKAV